MRRGHDAWHTALILRRDESRLYKDVQAAPGDEPGAVFFCAGGRGGLVD